MSFDLLFTVTVACTVVALLRLRAATIVIAANQAGVLRALSNIELYGQPRSQGFLPGGVFSLDNLAIAKNIFAICTVLLVVAVLWPARSRGRVLGELPKLPKWALVLLGLYLVVIAFSKSTIFSVGYNTAEQTVIPVSLSGGHAFLMSAVLYELVRRTRTGELGPRIAFAVLGAILLATDFLKGSTGLASGYLVTGAFTLLGMQGPLAQARSLRRRVVEVGVALLAVVALSVAVRGVRAGLAAEGARTVDSFTSSLMEKEGQASRTAEGTEAFGNSVQYAAHVLECISLYEAGVSRQWRSVYLPLEYTFEPSFLLGPLGITRPQEAAIELMDYYIHGGGIYVPGELYWNGGYLCVALVFAAILAFSFWCETRAPVQVGWLVMLCWYAPNLVQGIGYGFAQVSRGAINGLLALGVWRLMAMWARGRARRIALAGAAR